MSTADFLFSGQAPSVWTSPTYTNTSAPDWWQAAAQGLIGRASSIAGQPYQPYGGPRVAGFTPLQEDAMKNANAYTGDVNNMITGAGGMVSNAGQLFNKDEFGQFMSPYTDGVVNRIAQLGSRNLSENLLPAVNDTFIRSGQFGSRGNADFTLRALRDTQESVLGQQAEALESAQKNAMSNYQNAQGRQLQAGQTMGALGQLFGNENRSQLGFANTMGLQQQQLNQQNLDTAYGDFTAQRDYPLQMLNILNSVVRGYQPTAQTGGLSTTAYGGEAGKSGTSPLVNIAGMLGQWSGGRPNG